MTATTTFTADSDAAHCAAFQASVNAPAMAAHMRFDHGWRVLDADDLFTLRAMHEVSHHNEQTDPTRNHAHLSHDCLVGPLCQRATETAPYYDCGHHSCQALLHADCRECFGAAMDERGQFAPVLCDEHGWTYITDAGSNSGFMGEGVWWENWACGHGAFETGEVVL